VRDVILKATGKTRDGQVRARAGHRAQKVSNTAKRTGGVLVLVRVAGQTPICARS
jgi:hypothetical protein